MELSSVRTSRWNFYEERQRFIRHYKDVTGEQKIDMHKVAAYAKRIGWRMPTPPSDVEPGFFKLTHHELDIA